jgi:hypothetical protein
MEDDAERKERIRAFVEQVRHEMDERGLSNTPDGERGYAALIEAARQSGVEFEAEEEAIED